MGVAISPFWKEGLVGTGLRVGSNPFGKKDSWAPACELRAIPFGKRTRGHRPASCEQSLWKKGLVGTGPAGLFRSEANDPRTGGHRDGRTSATGSRPPFKGD